MVFTKKLQKTQKSCRKHIHLYDFCKKVATNMQIYMFFNFQYLNNISYCEFNELDNQSLTSHLKSTSQSNIHLELFTTMINEHIPLFSFFVKRTSKRK